MSDRRWERVPVQLFVASALFGVALILMSCSSETTPADPAAPEDKPLTAVSPDTDDSVIILPTPTAIPCGDLPLLTTSANQAKNLGVYQSEAFDSAQVFVSGNTTSPTEMILFIQGTGAVSAQWPSALTVWGANDLCTQYLLVFMDVPGYGQGTLTTASTEFSYANYSDVIDAVVNGVHADFGGLTTKVHVVAWSFGTFVAQRWMHDTKAAANPLPLGAFVLFGTKSGGANYPGGAITWSVGESSLGDPTPEGSYGGAAICAVDGLAFDNSLYAVAKGKTVSALLGNILDRDACDQFICDNGFTGLCDVSSTGGVPLSCETNSACDTVYQQGKLVADSGNSGWGALDKETLAMERRLAGAFSVCTIAPAGGGDAVCRYNGKLTSPAPDPSNGAICDCGTELATTDAPCPAAHCLSLPSGVAVTVVTGGGDAFIREPYQDKYAGMVSVGTHPVNPNVGHGYIVEGAPDPGILIQTAVQLQSN